MDTKLIGTIAFFAGLVLALLTLVIEMGDWVTQVLILLGILIGIFHPIRHNLIQLALTYLVLTFAGDSMQELRFIGVYITDIVNIWVKFLGPVVLTAFMLWSSAELIAMKEKE